MTIRKIKAYSETNTSAGLTTYAKSMGAVCLRLQAGRVKVKGAWMYLNPPGTTDRFLVFPFPDHDFLEVKRDLESLEKWYLIRDKEKTPKQRDFMNVLAAMGWTVRIAYSVEDYVYQKANNLSYSNGYRHQREFGDRFINF